MAKLPEIPSLDLDAPTDAAPLPVKAAGGPVQAGGVPVQAARPVPSQQPPVPSPDNSADALRVVVSPGRQPTLPPAAPRDNAASGGSEVQDSVEEVLQHTSAQTLKLSHLEDVLGALNRTLSDLQDEMHAGFAEIRAVTETSVANVLGSRETAVRDKQPGTPALELLEEQVVVATKRQTLLLIVAALQTLLLAVALVAILRAQAPDATLESTETPTPAAALAPATAAPSAADTVDPSSALGEDSKRKDTKKRKGRHR